jgi:hypothetical protein
MKTPGQIAFEWDFCDKEMATKLWDNLCAKTKLDWEKMAQAVLSSQWKSV